MTYPEVDMRARILRLVNDKYYNMGMLALTDRHPYKEDFTTHFDCKCYTYPLEPVSEYTEYKLTLIKMRECYPLLASSDDDAEGLLTQDSGFCVALANRYMFELTKEQFES